MPPYAIGFDLGATQTKWVAITRRGRLIDHGAYATEDDTPPEHLSESALWAGTIRRHVEEYERSQGVRAAAIGLAAPGLASEDGRFIAHMPGRLAGLERLDWTDFLGRSQRLPVLNDAHAAMLAETWRGAAKGFRDAILLTLGTGVGGAIMMGGRLVYGKMGRAGHLGHICLNPTGPPDVTGVPGSLEDAIGECTLEDRSEGKFTNTRDLVAAYLSGDREASVIWLASVFALACGIASLVNVLDPEAVVLGGGITQAGPALFNPLRDFLDEIEWRPGDERVKIIPAKLGPFAGAIGAARLALIDADQEETES